MRNSHKTIAIWLLIILMFYALYQVVVQPSAPREAPKFSKLLKEIEDSNVKDLKVTLTGRGDSGVFLGKLADGTEFQTTGIFSDDVMKLLTVKGVPFEVVEKSEAFWPGILVSLLPVLLMVVIFFVFMRQLQSGGGKAMSFGKSKAKLMTESQNKITFNDVAGVDEARDDVEEIIEFLRDPKKFTRLGGRIPKGVLLMGPPGTGKTLIARAIAGEAGVPFFTISGSDFVEMFVGVGASRVRDLFEQGKKNAPCIIFIDEIDAVGRHRGAGLGGGHDEREQTLNQLLVEMDGFESNDGVILVAATNRPDVLDPALLRPGRFDRRIVVPRPDVRGRQGILKVHTKRTPLDEGVALEVIARATPGFSGADLENLVNEAALLAARRNRRVVAMADFEAAKDKVMMGAERRSMVMSDEEKRLTAYHEAGHALVNLNVPGNDPLHKITIIPRGRALGLTFFLPEKDRYGFKKSELLASLATAYGGRIAEEIVFGPEHITTGAGGDIQQATIMARRMVTEWGMSEKLGAIRYNDNQDEVFLGHSIARTQSVSAETAKLIDQEVKRICDESEDLARKVLTEHLDDLHMLAKALLEYETLSGDEVRGLLRGEPIHRDEDGGASAPNKPRASVPTTDGADKPGRPRPGGLEPEPQPGA